MLNEVLIKKKLFAFGKQRSLNQLDQCWSKRNYGNRYFTNVGQISTWEFMLSIA